MTKTAAEKRDEAKVRYNAFLAVCPSRQLLDRLSNKWVTLVLCALGPGDGRQEGRPLRYAELAREVAGVSQKMLTQTLRGLEREGLVTRTVTLSVPVTVTYALTPLGRSLHEAVRHLKRWAEEHMDDVLKHRAATSPPADCPSDPPRDA